MLSGRFPFWGTTDIEYIRSFTRGPCMIGERWSEVSENAKLLVQKLLHLKAEERPTAREALAHPWFSQTSETQVSRTRQSKGIASFNSITKLATELCGRIVGKCEGVGNKKNCCEGLKEHLHRTTKTQTENYCEPCPNGAPCAEITNWDSSNEEKVKAVTATFCLPTAEA